MSKPQTELHLELLLGKPVQDATGKTIGRIEEVRAVRSGSDWVIQEYLVGSTALLERLSAWTVGLSLLTRLGAKKIVGGHRVPWDRLDLSDPDRPRLHCSLDELKELSDRLEREEKPQEQLKK